MTNFKNRKLTEMAETAWKMLFFRPSKHQSSVIFQDIYLTFCTHIHLTGLFHIYSGFWKFEKKICFLNNIFFLIIIQNFRNFQNLENLRLKFDRNVHSQPSVENQSFLFLNCLRDSVSRKPLFLSKTGKTWRHSDVIYGRRIKASKFSFCQDV